MVKVDKQHALFITGVVIACGEPDSDGDILEKEDIKRLMSSYLSQKVDTNHDFLENFGVKIIENYTTKTAEKVKEQNVPKNSWLCKMMIWDEQLKRDIRQGRLDGLSLASQPDNNAKDYKDIFNKRQTYKDFNTEDLTPSFISIVKNPANGYPLEYYSYDSYITKNRKENDYNMSEENSAIGNIAEKLVDALLEQNTNDNENKIIDETSVVTKAMPPQGGVAPQQMQQQPMGQPVSLDEINNKLDHLISMLGGGQQPMKSTAQDEKEEEVTKAEVTEEDEEEVTKAEEKTNDETQEPTTNSVGVDEGVVSRDGKAEVEPSTMTEGTKPQNNKKKHVLKQEEAADETDVKRDVVGRPIKPVVKAHAPLTDSDNVISPTYTKQYIPAPNVRQRDLLGRPIRD